TVESWHCGTSADGSKRGPGASQTRYTRRPARVPRTNSSQPSVGLQPLLVGIPPPSSKAPRSPARQRPARKETKGAAPVPSPVRTCSPVASGPASLAYALRHLGLSGQWTRGILLMTPQEKSLRALIELGNPSQRRTRTELLDRALRT